MKNIALIGLMGSGKSTVGKLLAQNLNLSFVDSDEEIEKKQNLKITEIFSLKGEDFFRQLETQTLKELCQQTNLLISTGGGAVQKKENLDTLKKFCTIIYLKASPEIIFERIKNDSSRPLLQNENPLQTLKLLLEKREDNYKKADIIIDTNNKTIDEILKEIIKNVES
jgi:shikimate kinase